MTDQAKAPTEDFAQAVGRFLEALYANVEWQQVMADAFAGVMGNDDVLDAIKGMSDAAPPNLSVNAMARYITETMAHEVARRMVLPTDRMTELAIDACMRATVHPEPHSHDADGPQSG